MPNTGFGVISVETRPGAGEGGWAYLLEDGTTGSGYLADCEPIVLHLEAMRAVLALNRAVLRFTADAFFVDELSKPSRGSVHTKQLGSIRRAMMGRVTLRSISDSSVLESTRRRAQSEIDKHHPPQVKAKVKGSEKPQVDTSGKTTARTVAARRTSKTTEVETIRVATDGSFNPDSGGGAWAWWIDGTRNASGTDDHLGTSGRMEARAILEALLATNPGSKINALCDSLTLVRAITNLQEGGTELSPDTWGPFALRLPDLLRDRTVSVTWVRGHSGVKLNVQADAAARKALRSRWPS